MRRIREISGDVVQSVIEAAGWAPSVHNTQPWWFGTRSSAEGPVISLHADMERRLEIADPDGREMLIGCGAALFTLRLAIQRQGFEPVVTLFGYADRPGLLADVGFGAEMPVNAEIEQLYEQVLLRRSHRGGFRDVAASGAVQATLAAEARDEGATLEVAVGEARIALAALTEAAEQVQHSNPRYVAEILRWAPEPGSERGDGVPQHAYPQAGGVGFAGRDFARGLGWGLAEQEAGAVGTVALLTTRGDDRVDWLTAGQALQRMLLRGSALGLSAAFHTQALEIPELREFIRTRLCAGAHPQVLLRLGFTERDWQAVRRPVEHIRKEEP